MGTGPRLRPPATGWRAAGGRAGLRHQAQHPALADFPRLAGKGPARHGDRRRHPGVRSRRRVSFQRSGGSGGIALCQRSDARSPGQEAGVRDLSGSPDSGPRDRRPDLQARLWPSRRQSSGQGPHQLDGWRLPRRTMASRSMPTRLPVAPRSLISISTTIRWKACAGRASRSSPCSTIPKPRPVPTMRAICSNVFGSWSKPFRVTARRHSTA